MSNQIIAIHSALVKGANLDNLKQILAFAQQQNHLPLKLMEMISEYCSDTPLEVIKKEIEANNHQRNDDLKDYSFVEIVEEFALILTAEDIRDMANSSEDYCALGHFQAYQFIFLDDPNDNTFIRFVGTDKEDDTQTIYHNFTMNAIYNMFLENQGAYNPFGFYDNCACEIIQVIK